MYSNIANSKNELCLLEWAQKIAILSWELLQSSYKVLQTEQQLASSECPIRGWSQPLCIRIASEMLTWAVHSWAEWLYPKQRYPAVLWVSTGLATEKQPRRRVVALDNLGIQQWRERFWGDRPTTEGSQEQKDVKQTVLHLQISNATGLSEKKVV